LQDAKEQVRQAVDIVDLVGGYIALRRQGRGYVGLCPWHDDSRPSMQVNPERQSFKCWVCDVGGDVFSFIMRAENLEFREALEMLAERAGISLAPAAKPQAAGESQFDRRNLFRAMAWAEEQFQGCLLRTPEAEPARRYLADRGITAESAKAFHVGFSPPEWDWLVKRGGEAGWSPAVLERVGLAGRRESGGYYDRFRGRLMFSIRDVRSRPIAFGGRVLPEFARDGDAKYVNSPETPLFNKSSQLYALDMAREGIAREKCVLVMEGYTDVIMAHQHGIAHAVAVLGTALGEKHVPLVRRFTDSITLVLDGDAAGQSRTMDILDNLLALFVAHEIDLKILSLPTGADPCDVISSHGSDEFRRMLGQSVDALQHKILAVTNGLVPGADAHRSSQAVEAILATLARALPAAAASSASLMREQQVLVRLARQFGQPEDSLRGRLRALRRSTPTPARASVVASPTASLERASRPSAWDRELIEVILYHAEALAALSEHVQLEDVESGAARELYRLALELHGAGTAARFAELMSHCDDEAAKSLLVDCDEHGAGKKDSDHRRRVRDLLFHLEQRRQEPRHQTMVADINQGRLDEDAELETLKTLYHDLSRRQAGPAPTDG
jgi:DNA primase